MIYSKVKTPNLMLLELLLYSTFLCKKIESHFNHGYPEARFPPISLAAGEIFVNESSKNKKNSKYLHLISEIIVSGGYLPKPRLAEGF